MKLRWQYALLLLLIGGGAYLYGQHRLADRSLPPFDERPQVRPSSEFLNVGASIAFYEAAIRREPAVVNNYVELAQVYMQQARSSGRETTYLPKARELLDEALRRRPDHYHARVLQGTLYNTLHQFEKGRDVALELIAEHSGHAYTYGTLLDAYVELGHYDQAVETCDKMLRLKPGLPAYARASYLRELHGDLEGAIEAMRLAADAGAAGRENRAWALFQLGQLYLRQARLDTASYIFNGLLEERPGYAFAHGGLAQVDYLKGRPDEALRKLEAIYAEAPHSSFLGLMLEIYEATGQARQAQATVRKIEASFEEAASIGENVDLEYADFLADQGRDLRKALRLARRDYERRPGHLHAAESYAWALNKNGRTAEAIPYIEQALRLNTGDAMVHYRAGTIYEAAGRLEEAAQHLTHALRAHLHIESRKTAQYARGALDSLQGALSR